MGILQLLHKPQYFIVFVRSINNSIIVISIMKYKRTSEQIVKFNNKSYEFNVNKPTYINLNKYLYFIDVDSGAKYFVENTIDLNPSELDTIIGQKIIQEIAKGVIDNNKEKVIWIILGAVIGGLALALIMSLYYQDKIDKIYADMNDTSNIITINIVSTILRGLLCQK